MKISAELILASKNAVTGDTLVTMVLTYPRPILAEFNTHRMFSRSTSSTRAIPAKKMRQTVWNEPYIPQYIGTKRKGMQAGPELRGWRRDAAETVMFLGSFVAIAQNWVLDKLGVAKEISGRYLEPYMWVRQVVTATDWKNFLLLRNNKAAEPHMRELARCISWQLARVEAYLRVCEKYGRDDLKDGQIQILQPGQWHIPFLTAGDEKAPLEERLIVSAARAARTSYTVTGGQLPNWERDIELANRLSIERHMSPFEHQAQAVTDFRYHANLKSFIQYRKSFIGEDGGDRTMEVKQ